MNRGIAFALAGFAALVIAAMVISGHLSPAHAVGQTVEHQVQLWNQRDINGLYSTLSPAAQLQCPLQSLEPLAQKVTAGAGGEVAVKDLGVQVQGDRAEVTGFVTLGGEVVLYIQPDDPAVYVKTDGAWKFDSMGSFATACRTLASAGGPGL